MCIIISDDFLDNVVGLAFAVPTFQNSMPTSEFILFCFQAQFPGSIILPVVSAPSIIAFNMLLVLAKVSALHVSIFTFFLLEQSSSRWNLNISCTTLSHKRQQKKHLFLKTPKFEALLEEVYSCVFVLWYSFILFEF